MLTASDLSAGHGARSLFQGLSVVVAPGDVIGLVGANGAGKSTLLRLLAGLERPESGTVSVSPPGAPVGYLPQEPERRPGESVRAFLGRRTGVTEATAALQRCSEALAGGEPDADEAYSTALETWLALGGADLDERAEVVTEDLGLHVDLDAPVTGLSGGQAARASLAAIVLSRYELYLLDEPTNDLDLDGLDRLESFVTGLRAGAVVVSHDREFLSRTVTSVLELDLHQQSVASYGGGYASYLAEREVAREHARKAYDDYSGTVAGLEERARTQRAWMAKGVRNARRKAPDNDKIGKAFRTEASEKQAAKARQTERLIERLEAVDEPRKEWQLQMTLAAAPRAGAVVATLRQARVQRGDFTLGPIDAEVGWGDRIVVTGPNGGGKSTLLAVLLGRVEPASGFASLGAGVIVGEVDQARRLLGSGESLLESVRAHLPQDMPPAEVRTLLAKFGLRGDSALRAADSLSAGERTRAALALLQARGTNLLVLDEPTNHLDLPAIEQLESALDSYPGTVLLVTHDRRMLASVRATRRWEVRDGALTES